MRAGTLRASTMVVHTARLDVEPTALDLVAFAGSEGVLWQHDGICLAGRGTAARVPVERADEVLARIEVEADDVERPGTGPVALGALPFAPGAGGTLVVPERVIGVDREGNAWSTSIGIGTAGHGAMARRSGGVRGRGIAPPSPPSLLTTHRQARRSPSDFRLTAVPTHAEWCATLARALKSIEAGEVEKVVLARAVEVEADGPLLVTEVLRRLRALFPSCMVFSVDGFVGASPELLVARLHRAVRSQPLAGTVARSGDPATDRRLARELLASAKDRHEHDLVVDSVASALRPLCARLDVPPEPDIVPLRNVSHLGTTITGRLEASAPSALGLARRLHPTPAVAGTPTAAALELITRLEGSTRGRYAGPVGWIDGYGNGEWAVGIRSAQIAGSRARLMSGVGIVAGSDPAAELAETQLKLQALLAAIVRP